MVLGGYAQRGGRGGRGEKEFCKYVLGYYEMIVAVESLRLHICTM